MELKKMQPAIKCEHPKHFVEKRTYYSIHGKELGKADFCLACHAWVERVKNG